MHILLWLDSEYKYPTIIDIDFIISAELPDENMKSIRYESVLKFMMHGPCGYENPKVKFLLEK